MSFFCLTVRQKGGKSAKAPSRQKFFMYLASMSVWRIGAFGASTVILLDRKGMCAMGLGKWGKNGFSCTSTLCVMC